MEDIKTVAQALALILRAGKRTTGQEVSVPGSQDISVTTQTNLAIHWLGVVCPACKGHGTLARVVFQEILDVRIPKRYVQASDENHALKAAYFERFSHRRKEYNPMGADAGSEGPGIQRELPHPASTPWLCIDCHETFEATAFADQLITSF